MDVRPAGIISPVLESLLRLRVPAVAGLALTPEDTVASLLELLSTPEFHNLMESIDAQVFTRDTVVLDSLLRTAATAVANHDIPRALVALRDYMNRNPEHAAALLTDPAFLPIHGEVKGLLRHLTHEAGSEAHRLFAAAQEAVDVTPRQRQELNCAFILDLAQRLIESAQLTNYFRASELSRTVITSCSKLKLNSAPAPRSTRRLWRRAPVPGLLLGLLALALALGAIASWLGSGHAN